MTFSENYLGSSYNEIIRDRAFVEARSDYSSLEEMLQSNKKLTRECRIHGCVKFCLYYTDADHSKGWRIMMARKIQPALEGKE